MRLCVACRAELTGADWTCPACGHAPLIIDGVPVLAPERSDTRLGVDPEVYVTVADFEAGSFWFVSRNALIVWALRKYGPSAGKLLEVGCGTGFVLDAISHAFPQLSLTGSELHMSGLEVARGRLGDRSTFVQLDARELPYRDEFDVIGTFDVLEHITEDGAVLSSFRDALRPKGILIATVPQHPFLWSPSDDLACHVRRYKVGELERKCRSCGFRLVMSCSFVTLLFPALVMSRLFARSSKHYDAEREMRLGRLSNWAATKAMSMERALIRAGVRLPLGGSCLLVAEKPA